MFNLEEYEIIDISYTVVPGENPDRPFAIQKALLDDKTFRYDILKTHSHVGTHVEVGAHFYEDGKTVSESEEIQVVDNSENLVILRVGSGKYRFHVK